MLRSHARIPVGTRLPIRAPVALRADPVQYADPPGWVELSTPASAVTE